MNGQERRAILKVERGLHTLVYRYDPAFALALDAAPSVRVAPSSNNIFLVTAPGEAPGLLAEPGRALVVLAEEDGTLELVLTASRPGGSLAAEVELSRIEGPRAAPAREARPRPELPDGGVEFITRAHVSLRGDVSAGRGAWICGPDAPGRIEGFEVRAVGGDLPLEYQVAAGGRNGGWSAWLPAGAYAGSRGKALPLIGLRLRLKPGFSPDLVLKGEGLFLGSQPVSRSGREIELVGPSPLDPLVGFRLDLAKGEAAGRPAAVAPSGEGRLRIFRRPPKAAASAAA